MPARIQNYDFLPQSAESSSETREPVVSSVAKADYALDASALLAVMLDEPGHEKIRAVIDNCCIHSVNVAEVVGRLAREGVPRGEAQQMIEELGLDIGQELTPTGAVLCGELLAKTRRQGLSLGDCICLTVAAGSTVTKFASKWLAKPGHKPFC